MNKAAPIAQMVINFDFFLIWNNKWVFYFQLIKKEILQNSATEFSINGGTASATTAAVAATAGAQSAVDLNNNNLLKQLSAKSSGAAKKSAKSKSSSHQHQSGSCSSGGASNASHGNKRNKRYRTSFKHQQLGVLKAYFQMNPNPDSKDLSVLSKRTGLQNRVLQVQLLKV